MVPLWQNGNHLFDEKTTSTHSLSLSLSLSPLLPSPHLPTHRLRTTPHEQDKEEKDWTHAYADDLKADVYTEVNADPKATVHSVEWRKIMNGDPVEINPTIGAGQGDVMS